ncbi:MAG: hypothetical protein B6242_02960 [Anaerolineaceae bacterium 4572_78]|nr:MAG: hypothetical protein B6242_02960 [Anaerolineaceae bacterium 4572_78]
MQFLRRIFTREKISVDTSLETTEIETDTSEVSHYMPGLNVAYQTDVGQVREQNEDSLYALNVYLEANDETIPFGIFIVADGMGGYLKGEVASSTAVHTVADYLLSNIYMPILNENTQSAKQKPIREILEDAILMANTKIMETTPEAGTTLTVAMVMRDELHVAHVGDSRAYLYHDNDLEQLTVDHSLVARLVELGQVTPEEALVHPQRNVLYRAVGQTDDLDAEVYYRSFPANSYLLMCSDGLWGLVDDEEIAHILSSPPNLQSCVSNLITTANANGGDDNITVILVGMGELPM